MLLEIFLSLILGVLAGTITGITPGIHINLVFLFLLSATSFLLGFFPPISLAVFIASMAITHTFIDFVPSIYLGAPDEDTCLSILPGHRSLLLGKAHEAVILTLIGSEIAIALTILITPIFIVLLPIVYPFLERMMAWLLIWSCIFLILNEKTSKIWAIIIFILSGFLGVSTLNLQINQPLLPLLTGLFGTSTLIYSLNKKTKIPEQKISSPKIKKSDTIKPIIATSLVSPIAAFLPGLGSSQAAIISLSIFKITEEQFLMLLGSINTLVMSLSFVTLYLIQKSRTGAAAAISQLLNLSFNNLIVILIAITISSLLALYLSIKISKIFSNLINKINYPILSLIIIIFLFIIVFIFSGFVGILILISSTVLGLFCIYTGVRRGFLMGCLLVPTILFYLPF